jgi:hypothetical protein
MRIWGILLGLLGAAILVISLLADVMKVGTAPLFFGWKQVLGVTAGTMMILSGFIIAIPGEKSPER